MNPIWKKMQVKKERRFLLLWMPEELRGLIYDCPPEWEMTESHESSAVPEESFDGIVIWVTDEEGITTAAELLSDRNLGDETLLWFCYPKQASKRYRASISRDRGWDPLIDLGWEGVRQVSVNEDWSALRFRPREAMKRYTRKKEIGRTGA